MGRSTDGLIDASRYRSEDAQHIVGSSSLTAPGHAHHTCSKSKLGRRPAPQIVGCGLDGKATCVGRAVESREQL